MCRKFTPEGLENPGNRRLDGYSMAGTSFVQLHHVNPFFQKIGAWYSASLSEFIVWAPLRRQVELVIRSDKQGSRAYPMERDPWGYWKISLSVEAGTRYLFRLDGKDGFPDPASISQPEGVHAPSVLLDREDHGWADEGWKGLPLSNMIIYELHTGLFSSTHDFEGIIRKLEYFVGLGVNAIELMPLSQFPGERNWGYDGVYPFAIQESYGGMHGFKRLVDAAHQKGVAVIVDTVYNHLGPEGNYLHEYGPYFTDKYHTPWGRGLNFDGAWCDGVRNFFLQNARMWLEELHVDALRLDAVHAIVDLSANPFMRQLKELALDISRLTGCSKEIIAETDLNDPKYIEAPEKGGYGLDGQWNDEFHHSLHVLLTNEQDGYHEDFGGIGHLEKAFRETFVYNGNYSPHRKKLFGAPTQGPYSRYVVFSQNHDQIGNREKGDRLSNSLSLAQLKLAAATVLLSPYVPLLFMGEEYGEKNPFLFFTSFSDPDLIDAIRKGRAAEFQHPGGDFPDPQDGASFERCMLSWKYKDAQGADLFNFYRELIHFRKTRPAMQGILRNTLLVHPAKDDILSFERKILNDHLYVWLNFNDRAMKVKNTSGSTLHLLIDSSGSGAPNPVMQEHDIHLSPYSASVFEIRS